MAAGLPLSHDFNTGNNEGVGYFKVNQRNGRRMNTAKAFLRVENGPALKVETQAHTQRVLLMGGRAVGVEYLQGGAVKTARTKGEVILSAGAVGSPQILHLSGIGPGLTAQTEAELMSAAGDIGTTIFHPVGTVHMGTNESAPLDPRLRMRGIGGLRVVDASVMPTITSGNTNAPTIMIALRGVRFGRGQDSTFS